jgi:hypothetical protein
MCTRESIKRHGIYTPVKQQTNWQISKLAISNQRSQFELTNSVVNSRVDIQHKEYL